jgi:hypothetical protein
MAKKAPAKKAPTKRKPRAKKPVVTVDFPALDEAKAKSIAWRSWLVGGAKSVALIVCGAVAGVYAAGGLPIGPSPVVYTDSLAESHTNDRATQVRILREYAGKTFANEPEAQKWLNEQRIAARPDDWGPYTDELGVAADQGPDAVKAFADKLEGKQ